MTSISESYSPKTPDHASQDHFCSIIDDFPSEIRESDTGVVY